jgi:sialic acid synthase SpsE
VFRKNMERVTTLLGSFEVKSLPSELPAIKNARRSLVAMKNIPKGKVIEYSDLTWKRPASGISPKYIDQVIGKKASVDIEEDTVMVWQLFQ